MLRLARVYALADFPLAVEICQGDVEAVDVGGDDGQDEHHAVEYEVLVRPCDHDDCERWEDDVEDGYHHPLEEWDPHLGEFGGSSLWLFLPLSFGGRGLEL